MPSDDSRLETHTHSITRNALEPGLPIASEAVLRLHAQKSVIGSLSLDDVTRVTGSIDA